MSQQNLSGVLKQQWRQVELGVIHYTSHFTGVQSMSFFFFFYRKKALLINYSYFMLIFFIKPFFKVFAVAGVALVYFSFLEVFYRTISEYLMWFHLFLYFCVPCDFYNPKNGWINNSCFDLF